MQIVIHIIHVLSAGIWLGGLVFTTAVVSPAFKAMSWTPAERMAVRSAVGRKYSKVANANLVILLVAAIIDAIFYHWKTVSIIEIVLVVIVCVLAVLHGAVFAPRLAAAAREQRHDDRAKLLRLSISISMLNLLLSFVVMVLAIGFSLAV
ncbi:MAG: DUF4149 domain-containing protein [Abditibacteriaceae bacterium]